MNNFEWTQLLNPEFYITLSVGGIQIGLYVVLFIVFAETGLFAGFFLPGDSLLFLSGIYSRDLVESLFVVESDFVNVTFLSTMVAIAGILGNMVGYWFGAKSGYYLLKKEDTFWFKKKYLLQSKDFFEKYGGKAIIYARFLPIFRTFAPIVAGIVSMDKKKFMFFNILSSFMWAFLLIFAGHYLYDYCIQELDFDLKEHIELIVIGIIFISTFPVLINLFVKTPEGKKKLSIGFLVICVIILISLFSFHFIPSRMMIFPKEHLTLKKTILTDESLNKLIDDYNNSNVFDQMIMRNDPLVKKLLEKGVIKPINNRSQ